MDTLGIVVGLSAEARMVRAIARTRAGGGTEGGALTAGEQLVADGVRALLSFGLSGGLDPRLRPGALIVPRMVLAGGERFSAAPDMIAALGGPTVDLVLAGSEIARDAADKRRLWQQTGAAAIDMESGAVARVARRHGLPFAVLRAVCDPAERSLPPAALLALDQTGAIDVLKVLGSVAASPSQIPALLTLTRDAATARRALIRRVAELGNRLAGV